LQPLADLAPLLQQSVQILPYAAVMANASDAPHRGQGEPRSRSGLIEHLTPEFSRAVETMLASGDVHFFAIRSVGGAVADVDPDATAYAHRTANFSVAALGSDADRLDRVWRGLHGHFGGLYLSFDTDQSPERLTDAFPEATLARLRLLKARFDPQNTFRDNFNIV